MQLEDTRKVETVRPEPSAASPWRAVVLPSEHGGWSLTAEPAILGIVVAFSWPGVALGVAAMLAFLARTPLKLVLVDLWRHRWLDRTTLAAGVAAAEIAMFAGLVIYATLESDEPFWLPLLVALPLVATELWFDMRSRGRRLIPELAGSVGIGSIATAIALADGVANSVAWGLWLVIAARSGAAIPYVRTQILRFRSRPASPWASDTAQVLGAGAVAIGWLLGLVPVAAMLAVITLALVNVAALRLPPRPAVVIGIQQMMFGAAVITTTAVAVLAAG